MEKYDKSFKVEKQAIQNFMTLYKEQYSDLIGTDIPYEEENHLRSLIQGRMKKLNKRKS